MATLQVSSRKRKAMGEDYETYERTTLSKRHWEWWKEKRGAHPWMVEWYKERNDGVFTHDWEVVSKSIGDITPEKYELGQSILDHYEWTFPAECKRRDPNEYRHWMKIERFHQDPLVRAAWSEFWDQEMDAILLKDVNLYNPNTEEVKIAFTSSFFWTIRNRLPDKKQQEELEHVRAFIGSRELEGGITLSSYHSTVNVSTILFNKG